MKKHFPNLSIPSESFYGNCSFNWKEINISQTNELNVDDLKAIPTKTDSNLSSPNVLKIT